MISNNPELDKLLNLNNYKGTGTSIVSLVIPPKMQVSAVCNHITKELGTASNIKDKTNRKSVIDALKSTEHFYKSLKQIPCNGIATYCGQYF